MVKWKPLVVNLVLSLGVGLIAALFTMDSMKIYESVNKPKLSPPPTAFPIVWTILFVLMGVSAYLIYISNDTGRKEALRTYGFQLIVNAIWPILFFNCQIYLISFIWLLLLWFAIISMIILFCRIRPLAGILQIPYLLWVTFAGYLNFMIYLLNT